MSDTLKRMLKNLILVLAPLIILVLFTALFPLSYMSEEYVMWYEEWSYVNHSDVKTDMLILGDSRAKSSLIPALMDHDGSIYNIAIGGATPIEMYYAVKNHIIHHGAPKEAVVIFAPYHFCDIDNWDQTLFNNYLSVSEITEVYENAFKFHNGTVLKDGWFTDELSFRLRLPNKYLAQIYDARFLGYEDRNRARLDMVRGERGYCEFGSDPGNDGESYEVHHKVFDSDPLVLYYFDELIGLLQKNGVKVTIMQSPVNETSNELITSEFRQGYADHLASLEAKYPQITVYKEIPCYENEYFGDNNHLNRKGAERFTKEQF
ncbi:MAG: hypothetical protein K6F86_04210 [Lachnospiraceae bacterium]|nr:hypothetical protein [Lachnospiraceae bacterium]